MAYTTVALVSAEILQTIDGSSTPTDTQVTQWITEAEDEINELTGTKFESTAVTNSVIPFTSDTAFRETSLAHFHDVARHVSLCRSCNAIFLQDVDGGPKRAPIVSIGCLQVNSSSSFSTEADSFTSLTENTGSGGDFIVDKEMGKIVFLRCAPQLGHLRGINVTFNYGFSTLPERVKTLATKMVARRVLIAKANASQFDGIDSFSLEGISKNKSISQTTTFLRSLDRDIERLRDEVVGTFRVEFGL